jgi:acetyl-CoA carboxylase carboxyltransferase component
MTLYAKSFWEEERTSTSSRCPSIHGQQIVAVESPEQTRAAFIADYRARFMSPYEAAGLGFIDEVTQPRTLRPRLASYLSLLKNEPDQNFPQKVRQYSALRGSFPSWRGSNGTCGRRRKDYPRCDGRRR